MLFDCKVLLSPYANTFGLFFPVFLIRVSLGLSIGLMPMALASFIILLEQFDLFFQISLNSLGAEMDTVIHIIPRE